MKKVYLVIILTIVLVFVFLGIEFLQEENEENVNSKNINQTTGDNSIDNNDINNNILEPSIDNVKMSIKEGSLSAISAKIIIEDKNEEPFGYEEWFRIDKNENGEWKSLEPINDNFSFTEPVFIPRKDGILEMAVNWEELYGSLKPGKYRLVKIAGENYIYTEFEIK